MSELDVSKILFRCSSLGQLMTEPKSKQDKIEANLSETAKSYLIDVYVNYKSGRKNEFTNKYVEKGLMVEEDSITLYSRVKKKFFLKNSDMLSNDYIKGTPDIFDGSEIITQAKTIIDIKSSWDIFSFFRTFTKPINKDYWWQLQGYMALTGATNSILAYCLVNTPDLLVNDEKRRLMYKMGAISEENEDFEKACKEIDFNTKYDDIPLKQRVNEFYIERDDDAIEKIYENVIKAREFISILDENMCDN